MENRHVLLIQSPDEKGLVHKVTGAMFRRELNIIENAETVDRTTNSFFMRTEFIGDFSRDDLLGEIQGFLPRGAQTQLRVQSKRRLLLFATKESHCLGDLLLRHHSGELNAEILGVVSQYEGLRELAERFSLPFHCVPVDAAKDRAAHEADLLRWCEHYRPDYIVLAKYMRVLGADFIAKYPERIINIHHSFLPAFIGASPYKQAFERGVKIIGATAHFVTEDLDDGPIITQSVIPVGHTEDPTQMARAGRDVERQVLAKALQLVLEDRVLVHGRRTVIF